MTVDLKSFDWYEIKSSNVAAIALSGGELYVRFNSGKVYRYDDDANPEVESLHKALFEAAQVGESVGKLFYALVRRPDIPAEKIEQDEGAVD